MTSTSSRIRIVSPRRAAAAAGVALALAASLALAGCSGGLGGFAGGSGSNGAGGSTSAAGSPASGAPTPASSHAPTAGPCRANGSGIPDGHYAGPIKATLTTTMTISGDGISIPNAGGGTEGWTGTVDVTSKAGKVTGTITMSELGLSQVGVSGGVQVHSVDDGELTGVISGSAAQPTVAATGTGEWASLDAPVLNGSGASTSTLAGGLHITHADCTSISGDAVAMFADFMSPVAQYLSVTGDGTWTANRK